MQDIRRFDLILIVLQKNIFYFLLFYFLLLFRKYFTSRMKNSLLFFFFFAIQFIFKNHFLSYNQIKIILIFLRALLSSTFLFICLNIHLILIALSESL